MSHHHTPTPPASHGLHNTWVVWEHKQLQKQEEWKFSMRDVGEFSTVEEFWRYWAFIPRPSEIFYDGNTRKEVEGRSLDGFSVFKKGIRPEWEDVANRSGSELSCRKTMTVDMVDHYWENMVFALLGETIDENDEICGCRVVDKSKKGSGRTMFRLELWLRSGNQEIGERIRLRLLDALAEGDGGRGNKSKVPEFEYKRRAP